MEQLHPIELQLHPDEGEKIDSGSDKDEEVSQSRPSQPLRGHEATLSVSPPKDSDGSDEEEVKDPKVPSYNEAVSKLRAPLGPKFCPPLPPSSSKAGTSAMDFFREEKPDASCPPLPQSRLVLDSVEALDKRIQGEKLPSGQALDSFPKGLSTGKFPSLAKPKVFAPGSYLVADPLLGPQPTPLDPAFRQVSKGTPPSSSNIPMSVLENWESMARAGIQVGSHMDMFFFGILSILRSQNPSEEDLQEARRYLEALAYANKHIIDLLVPLVGGTVLARRDVHLSTCAP